MYRYRPRGYTSPYIPGSYGFRYISYNIFTGIKTEHLKGFDGYPNKAIARAEFLELISKWNGQAYGSIQYWAID